MWGNYCSHSFTLHQGVRQSTVLDALLQWFSASGYGASSGGVYCGALMHADNLLLIAVSAELQALLDIIAAYAAQ